VKIAVLGGGNGAYACAADLARLGHEVRLWRRDARALAPVIESGAIVIQDAEGERAVPIAGASGDIGEALRGAALVVVPAPAFAQAGIARACAPHLADGQVVFLPPGTFGSYLMPKLAREAGSRAEVAFAETGTLPWLARKHGPATVAITARATRLPTGVFPARLREPALAILREAFPSVEPLEDALSAALMNAGPIIHPPLIMMNAAPLEHFERWDIHDEGTQPAVRRVTDALDAERIAAREALGYGAPHFPLADHYRTDGDEWMYGRRAHEKLTRSKDWSERIALGAHRYMLEDVEQGLALLVSVCEWAGVPSPLARAFLAIGSAIAGRDFRRSGRTLESLGLARLARGDLGRLLEEGL
jgi:opine dehydrogenase